MTTRSSTALQPRPGASIAELWSLMTQEQRFAIAAIQPYGDAGGIPLDLEWHEIGPRDRERLLAGCRRLTGLSSLIECVLP